MTIGRFTTEHTEISPGFQTEEQKNGRTDSALPHAASSALFMFPVLLSENPLIANKMNISSEILPKNLTCSPVAVLISMEQISHTFPLVPAWDTLLYLTNICSK